MTRQAGRQAAAEGTEGRGRCKRSYWVQELSGFRVARWVDRVYRISRIKITMITAVKMVVAMMEAVALLRGRNRTSPPARAPRPWKETFSLRGSMRRHVVIRHPACVVCGP